MEVEVRATSHSNKPGKTTWASHARPLQIEVTPFEGLQALKVSGACASTSSEGLHAKWHDREFKVWLTAKDLAEILNVAIAEKLVHFAPFQPE